jgi:hypothetical protein
VTACSLANTGSATGGTTSIRPLVAIVGFGSSNTVYAVNDQGFVFSWVPGAVPAFKARRASTEAAGALHGGGASALLVGGTSSNNSDFLMHGLDATAGTPSMVSHSPSGVPTPNNGGVLGIWAWDSTHAYAVGLDGLVAKWNGATTWTFASPDAGVKTDFNSVVALDDSSVYIATQDGKIRRVKASSWDVHYSGATALEDIAVSSPQNIWAVGNGVVVHFPE